MNGKSCLLVIDMQKAYLPGAPWQCPDSDKAAEAIVKRIGDFAPEDVFFALWQPSENPKGIWKEYNEMFRDVAFDPELGDVMDIFKPYMNQERVFVKSSYSCLGSAELAAKLEDYDNVYVTGVMAECCVLSTVFGLLDMGKKVFYCRDCIAGGDAQAEDAAIKCLELLTVLQVELC